MASRGENWVRRWGMWMAKEKALTGVWRRRDGGFVVRGHVTDPRTGKLTEILRALPEKERATEAREWLEREKQKLRLGHDPESSPKPRFCDYAVDLFDRKKTNRDIQSESGREKWQNCLDHLLCAPFAEMYLDTIRHRDLLLWRESLGALTYEVRRRKRTGTRALNPATGRMKTTVSVEEIIETRKYDTTTLNIWLRVLRVITATMAREFELAKDPGDGLPFFPEADAYSEDQPNALNEAGELATFLAKLRELYPQHYAMVTLGFCIGHRPSTLRPITRRGPDPDLTFNADDTARLRIRRTHSRRQAVMEAGPTNKKLMKQIVIDLPVDLADVLRDHIQSLETDAVTRTSNLLFPSRRHGGMLSRTALAKPFEVVRKAMKLTKKLTPKAMRRSFKDVARAAEIPGVVRNKVSGHTDAMDEHYSSPTRAEKREAVAKVFDLATAREQRSPAAGGDG